MNYTLYVQFNCCTCLTIPFPKIKKSFKTASKFILNFPLSVFLPTICDIYKRKLKLKLDAT